MSNISTFKNQFAGGARANLFKCEINFPENGAPSRSASFMIKAASIPASTINKIDVPYRGRNLKVAGERTFEDSWTVTVYNDRTFNLRDAFERWMNGINTHTSNFSKYEQGSIGVGVGAMGYMKNLYVTQLDKGDASVLQGGDSGRSLARYQFVDAFPVNLGAIELSYETDEIETFEVEFAYQYWLRVGAGTTA